MQRILLTLSVSADWAGVPAMSTCARSSAFALRPWMKRTGPPCGTSRRGTRLRSSSTRKLGSDTSNVTCSFPAQSSNSTGRNNTETWYAFWHYSKQITQTAEIWRKTLMKHNAPSHRGIPCIVKSLRSCQTISKKQLYFLDINICPEDKQLPRRKSRMFWKALSARLQ